ncbi:MAG: L,D-transpeptidase family protein, partial [Myxococcales bacterium]|nr:L,D-transpeptidase family protein [Myxococcales bacterium]
DTADTTDTTDTADTADTADTVADTDTDTGATGGVEINPGWVGGACATAADCDSDDFSAAATCLGAGAGFPGGMCTQACAQGATSWLCPDTDYGPGTEYTVTRCVTTTNGTPTCASECDYGLSPTGCRPGYTCVLRQRHGQPDRIYPICLPSATQSWPGEPAKSFDIGAACTTSAGCQNLHCLALPGGYCTKTMCAESGCPAGSTCYAFDNSDVSACLRDCTVDSQCRTGAGYECDDYDTCWPSPETSAWNAGVGPSDCAVAWGTNGSGLSPCDTTKDDYVVVNKSARNLAVCSHGSNTANFWIGLGFTPSGDKEREGDGKTPEGVFYVVERLPNSSFYKAWLVSYPDAADAARGYSGGLITAGQKADIESAQASCGRPPQSTALGGLIELHGNGGKQDWTWGCVAMEDGEVDQLWQLLGVRDTIVIKP